MSGSIYHHHQNKSTAPNNPTANNPSPSKHSSNYDEVEAGSILVALANHHQDKSKIGTKSMSIGNLVESGHHKKHFTYPPSHQNQQYRKPSHDLPAIRANSLPSTPPTTASDSFIYNKQRQHQQNERMQSARSPGERNCFEHAMQSPRQQIHASHASHIIRGGSIEQRFPTTSLPYAQQKQQQQQQRQPLPPPLRQVRHPTTTVVDSAVMAKQQQQQHKQHNEFSRQYINMRRNPKIRKNALQAYISYMTYTDIARKRMKQQGIPATPPTTTITQHPTSKTILTNRYQPYQQHHQNRHHSRNTHFNLSSPIPSPSLSSQQYDHHRSSSATSTPTLVKNKYTTSPLLPSPPPRKIITSPPTPPQPTTKPYYLPGPPNINNIVVAKPLTAFLHRLPPDTNVTPHRYPPPPPAVVYKQ